MALEKCPPIHDISLPGIDRELIELSNAVIRMLVRPLELDLQGFETSGLDTITCEQTARAQRVRYGQPMHV